MDSLLICFKNNISSISEGWIFMRDFVDYSTKIEGREYYKLDSLREVDGSYFGSEWVIHMNNKNRLLIYKPAKVSENINSGSLSTEKILFDGVISSIDDFKIICKFLNIK